VLLSFEVIFGRTEAKPFRTRRFVHLIAKLTPNENGPSQSSSRSQYRCAL